MDNIDLQKLREQAVKSAQNIISAFEWYFNFPDSQKEFDEIFENKNETEKINVLDKFFTKVLKPTKFINYRSSPTLVFISDDVRSVREFGPEGRLNNRLGVFLGDYELPDNDDLSIDLNLYLDKKVKRNKRHGNPLIAVSEEDYIWGIECYWGALDIPFPYIGLLGNESPISRDLIKLLPVFKHLNENLYSEKLEGILREFC